MIETPPTIQNKESLNLPDSEKVKAVIAKIDSEYMYWSDLKYRADNLGMTPYELWEVIKFHRKKTDLMVWPNENIHFSLTNEMQRACYRIDMEFGGSWGASKIFPDDKTTQELYLVSSIMEEAIASSQMEGASTTREAAKHMLRNKIRPKDRSQRMILNNYITINFIREHKDTPLTRELIMQVHEMMTSDTLEVDDAAGRLRKESENIVVGNPLTGEIVHRPPKADCLDAFLADICDFFNATDTDVFIHPIIRGIIIHFLIAYYHPFADGNGRTARALFYWYMMKSNYWLVQYLSISRIIIKSKRSYEKAYLYSEADGNDVGYFIKYNLDILKKSFEELKKYLTRKNAEKRQAEKLLHLGNISTRETQILQMYINNPDLVLQAKELAAKVGVHVKTAKSDLEKLVQKGFVNSISLNAKTKAYIAVSDFHRKVLPSNM